MKKEIWKDVPRYKGRYMASNQGRIKSIERIVPFGNKTRVIKEKILSQHINHLGYLRVRLSKNCKTISHASHRIVLSAFNRGQYDLQVNHINGIKTDNRVENLEWCTQSENQIHAHKTGLIKPLIGSKAPSSKLNEDDVLFIREMLDGGVMRQFELCKIFNIRPATISPLKLRKTWKHI